MPYALWIWLMFANAAWTQGASVATRVHSHEFDRVRVTSQECSLELALEFSAPDPGYKDRSANRNRYYFEARVKFAGDHHVDSVKFKTSKPGRKRWTWTQDTTAEGCWAKQKPALSGVVVNGCRGKGCAVPPFD